MRMLACFAISIAVLLCGSPAFSQTPSPSPTPTLSISGATQIATNGQAVLTLTGPATSVIWLVSPQPPTPLYQRGMDCVFTGSGSYAVTAVALTAGQLSQTSTQVVFGGSPTPLAIAIFDPSTLTSLPAGQIAIYQSSTIAPSLASQGVTWLQYHSTDVIPAAGGTSVPIMQTKWGTAALQVGLPAYVTSNNGVVSAIPLPQSQAAIVSLPRSK